MCGCAWLLCTDLKLLATATPKPSKPAEAEAKTDAEADGGDVPMDASAAPTDEGGDDKKEKKKKKKERKSDHENTTLHFSFIPMLPEKCVAIAARLGTYASRRACLQVG